MGLLSKSSDLPKPRFNDDGIDVTQGQEDVILPHAPVDAKMAEQVPNQAGLMTPTRRQWIAYWKSVPDDTMGIVVDLKRGLVYPDICNQPFVGGFDHVKQMPQVPGKSGPGPLKIDGKAQKLQMRGLFPVEAILGPLPRAWEVGVAHVEKLREYQRRFFHAENVIYFEILWAEPYGKKIMWDLDHGTDLRVLAPFHEQMSTYQSRKREHEASRYEKQGASIEADIRFHLEALKRGREYFNAAVADGEDPMRVIARMRDNRERTLADVKDVKGKPVGDPTADESAPKRKAVAPPVTVEETPAERRARLMAELAEMDVESDEKTAAPPAEKARNKPGPKPKTSAANVPDNAPQG